jgi:hypothetical protein
MHKSFAYLVIIYLSYNYIYITLTFYKMGYEGETKH